MMTTARRHVQFFALAAMLGACDKPPIAPSTGVIRVAINGPEFIAPGTSASYSVIDP